MQTGIITPSRGLLTTDRNDWVGSCRQPVRHQCLPDSTPCPYHNHSLCHAPLLFVVSVMVFSIASLFPC